ncbi:hypothetical protein LINPERHAP2_LOCUS809 [Linum perenne]
MWRWISPNLYS